MFIFTEPFISGIAEDFILTADGDRIIEDSFITDRFSDISSGFITKKDAVERILARDGRWLYSNSENALVWLDEILPADHRLRKCIELFKNKLLFRQTYEGEFGGIRFREIRFEDLADYKFADFGTAFILKPTVGFLSAGVYRIDSQSSLDLAVKKLTQEMERFKTIFPASVLNSSSFIAEEIIQGREFAIDAFYSECTEPVILNIFEHKFRDSDDMSDRLYITSAEIIRNWLEPFKKFLSRLSEKTDLKGFVLHAEVRVDEDGVVKPIEINPLRFAGWCSTDLCYWAYGINPYHCFAQRAEPDWDTILAADKGKIHGMSVLSNEKTAGVKNFDYKGLAGKFADLKELREINYKKYPLFGFAFFTEEKDNTEFFDWLLSTDFTEFCSYAEK